MADNFDELDAEFGVGKATPPADDMDDLGKRLTTPKASPAKAAPAPAPKPVQAGPTTVRRPKGTEGQGRAEGVAPNASASPQVLPASVAPKAPPVFATPVPPPPVPSAVGGARRLVADARTAGTSVAQAATDPATLARLRARPVPTPAIRDADPIAAQAAQARGAARMAPSFVAEAPDGRVVPTMFTPAPAPGGPPTRGGLRTGNPLDVQAEQTDRALAEAPAVEEQAAIDHYVTAGRMTAAQAATLSPTARALLVKQYRADTSQR